MRTDRELLELAAKAAGLEVHSAWQKDRDAAGEGDVGLWLTNGTTCWNPLTDDGQALRLAVKMGIEPRRPSRSRSIGRVVQAWYPLSGNPARAATAHVSVPVSGDTLSATRRAITRAAAEIGRGMP